jgi:hypothetical protein
MRPRIPPTLHGGKTSKAIGLAVRRSPIDRADEVIE